MKPRPIALAASRRAPILRIEKPHGAPPLRLGERGIDTRDRRRGALYGHVVHGEGHAKRDRRGRDVAAALADVADQVVCLARRAPPCRCRTRGIAGHHKAARPW